MCLLYLFIYLNTVTILVAFHYSGFLGFCKGLELLSLKITDVFQVVEFLLDIKDGCALFNFCFSAFNDKMRDLKMIDEAL
ncbi:Uncharacterised protein [Suttonella ornithocola]|uniref:Uncharacterized protein n=1 Tax=Suttonella ornithocola TaxID=279832 RepID=A0A380MQA8_9GAMM|nr:Uncharacterised protein [Suttonella ornithocola]